MIASLKLLAMAEDIIRKNRDATNGSTTSTQGSSRFFADLNPRHETKSPLTTTSTATSAGERRPTVDMGLLEACRMGDVDACNQQIIKRIARRHRIPLRSRLNLP